MCSFKILWWLLFKYVMINVHGIWNKKYLSSYNSLFFFLFAFVSVCLSITPYVNASKYISLHMYINLCIYIVKNSQTAPWMLRIILGTKLKNDINFEDENNACAFSFFWTNTIWKPTLIYILNNNLFLHTSPKQTLFQN